MQRNATRNLAAVLALGALAACVAETPPPPLPPLAPLSADPQEPALALIEHVLVAHFTSQAKDADPATTCVELRPGGLRATQEQALIARFPRLAPRERCATQVPPPEDQFTGERAEVVQVYGMECSGPTNCAAFVAREGGTPMQYTLVFDQGAWAFRDDPAKAE